VALGKVRERESKLVGEFLLKMYLFVIGSNKISSTAIA